VKIDEEHVAAAEPVRRRPLRILEQPEDLAQLCLRVQLVASNAILPRVSGYRHSSGVAVSSSAHSSACAPPTTAARSTACSAIA
jgi:hypothetical protein